MHDVRNAGNRSKLERTVTLKENNTMRAESQETFKKKNAQVIEFTADRLIQSDPSEASHTMIGSEDQPQRTDLPRGQVRLSPSAGEE
jgi:hypothetical protein